MNELDQALLTGEKVVFATKKHWFSPVRDSAIAVLIVLGSFLLRWLAPQGEGAIISGIGNVFELVANLALIASILWIAWNVFAYVSANFGVSNMRVLRYEGIIQRRSSETLLSAVTDVQLKEPALGRMLGFGDLTIFTQSGDAGKDEFSTVKNAPGLRTAIMEQKTQGYGGAPAAPVSAPPVAVAPPLAPSTPGDPAAAMATLDDMRTKGLITDADYESKKAEILSRL